MVVVVAVKAELAKVEQEVLMAALAEAVVEEIKVTAQALAAKVEELTEKMEPAVQEMD